MHLRMVLPHRTTRQAGADQLFGSYPSRADKSGCLTYRLFFSDPAWYFLSIWEMSDRALAMIDLISAAEADAQLENRYIEWLLLLHVL